MKDQKIYFFTGKGGVGKSTVSAIMARELSQIKGSRVLLAELKESSAFRSWPNYKTTEGDNAALVFDKTSVSTACWPYLECLKGFLLHYVKSKKLVSFFFSNRFTQGFLNAAPALKELTLLGKATSGPRAIGPEMPYSEVVVDSYATGHFLSLLRVPKSMVAMKYKGPITNQSSEMLKVFCNSHIGVVTTFDPIVLEETKELIESLKSEFGVEVHLYFNFWIDPKWLPKEAKSEREEALLKHFQEVIKRQEIVLKKFSPKVKKCYFVPRVFENSLEDLLNQLELKEVLP